MIRDTFDRLATLFRSRSKEIEAGIPQDTSWRNRSARKKERSDAKALLGAIALGLVFALVLTIAASWAPESFARRHQGAPSAPQFQNDLVGHNDPSDAG
ncbi:hypothetical protein [Roseibium sp.]|uniref:hypothetical protein n=1 Tax=Roseibium sp. TaxID=1936156 RepID=UPI003A96C0AD